jgi:predicted alpha/beta hydrolase family esterase
VSLEHWADAQLAHWNAERDQIRRFRELVVVALSHGLPFATLWLSTLGRARKTIASTLSTAPFPSFVGCLDQVQVPSL